MSLLYAKNVPFKFFCLLPHGLSFKWAVQAMRIKRIHFNDHILWSYYCALIHTINGIVQISTVTCRWQQRIRNELLEVETSM